MKIMMRARCMALAARFAAPEATLGLYTVEELTDTLVEEV